MSCEGAVVTLGEGCILGNESYAGDGHPTQPVPTRGTDFACRADSNGSR